MREKEKWTTWGQPEIVAPAASPVVFLPGWGCSGRMLSLCAPARSWWSIAGWLDPAVFAAELGALLRRKGWQRIVLVGWSLGARLALEFASRHPAMVETLVLLSLRRDWPEPEIQAIRRDLLLDPAAYLKSFYRKCFLGHKEAWRQFVELRQEIELRDMALRVLEDGLDLLQTPLAQVVGDFEQCGLPPARVWLLHGEDDIIAPFSQRMLLTGARQLVVKHGGHALFLVPSVRDLTFLS